MVLAGCQKEDSDVPETTPEEKAELTTYKVTISATKGVDTKALSLDGTTLNAYWKATDKVKVYETTDTSYEYPFDRSSEEDQFAYFRIMGICDDGEELELSWATKVQVWPAANFFLLVCLTLLIYFWIKLFRETEA